MSLSFFSVSRVLCVYLSLIINYNFSRIVNIIYQRRRNFFKFLNEFVLSYSLLFFTNQFLLLSIGKKNTVCLLDQTNKYL